MALLRFKSFGYANILHFVQFWKHYFTIFRTWAVVSFLTLHLPSHFMHFPKVDWFSVPWSSAFCSVRLCKSCAVVDKSNDFLQFAKKIDDVCCHRNWIISHACHVSCFVLCYMSCFVSCYMFCIMLHVKCCMSACISCMSFVLSFVRCHLFMSCFTCNSDVWKKMQSIFWVIHFLQ